MALRIDIVGAKPIPRHESPVLPINALVPNRREAIEALGYLQAILRRAHKKPRSILIDGKVVTPAECFDTLHRFVLTR